MNSIRFRPTFQTACLVTSLLLAMCSWTRAENEITIRCPKAPINQVFELYRDLNTNTAVVLPAQIIFGNQTVTIMPNKPMSRSAAIGLIDDELNKQAGIKIRHVTLEEAVDLNTIEMAGKNAVLAVALPPLPTQSSAGRSNEVPSISFSRALLEKVRTFYEAVTGTKVVYEGTIIEPQETLDITLNISVPMTKDTARKLLEMTLAMQARIKVRQDQPGETIWWRDLPSARPKAKSKQADSN